MKSNSKPPFHQASRKFSVSYDSSSSIPRCHRVPRHGGDPYRGTRGLMRESCPGSGEHGPCALMHLGHTCLPEPTRKLSPLLHPATPQVCTSPQGAARECLQGLITHQPAVLLLLSSSEPGPFLSWAPSPLPSALQLGKVFIK